MDDSVLGASGEWTPEIGSYNVRVCWQKGFLKQDLMGLTEQKFGVPACKSTLPIEENCRRHISEIILSVFPPCGKHAGICYDRIQWQNIYVVLKMSHYQHHYHQHHYHLFNKYYKRITVPDSCNIITVITTVISIVIVIITWASSSQSSSSTSTLSPSITFFIPKKIFSIAGPGTNANEFQGKEQHFCGFDRIRCLPS